MRSVVAVVAVVVLAGCEGRSGSNDPPALRGEPEAGVRWVVAAPARAGSRWEAPAVARVDGLGSGDVTASVRVRVARVLAQVGDRVAAGQVVAEAEAPDLVRALASRAAASGRIAPLRAWRAELQAQRDAGFVRASELREVEARLADAEAELRRAEADVRASGFSPADLDALSRTGRVPLRAPVAGVLRAMEMVPGHVSDPGDPPLASISGERPVRVEVRLHAPWPAGASLRFEPLSGEGFALDPSPVSEAVDPEHGVRMLWLRPREPASLPAGTAGRVVVSGLPDDAVEVPSRALLRVEGGARVLARAGARTTPVPVTVLSISQHTAIVRGLRAGVEVAAEADRAEAR